MYSSSELLFIHTRQTKDTENVDSCVIVEEVLYSVIIYLLNTSFQSGGVYDSTKALHFTSSSQTSVPEQPTPVYAFQFG